VEWTPETLREWLLREIEERMADVEDSLSYEAQHGNFAMAPDEDDDAPAAVFPDGTRITIDYAANIKHVPRSKPITPAALEAGLVDSESLIRFVGKDGKEFIGYYGGECYNGRSEDYAVDYELQSPEYWRAQDDDYEDIFFFRADEVELLEVVEKKEQHDQADG
jgi:hypothetical protein